MDKTIRHAAEQYRSASIFRINRGSQMQYHGHRDEIPHHLMEALIKDCTYRIARQGQNEPMWEIWI